MFKIHFEIVRAPWVDLYSACNLRQLERRCRDLTSNSGPTLRTLDFCALNRSPAKQTNWLNVYSWTSLNTNFCFSVCVSICLSTEMENWIVISKVQMEPLVYSIILYTKWSCRRFKIWKGLPKIQTHYSFQQIWQFLNYINFWTFFLVHSC